MEIIRRVNSPSLRLLFDVYHVQIMDGDLIRRIRDLEEYIAHVQVAGCPGRGPLDADQEINYSAVMRAFAVGEVVRSKADALPEGAFVTGMLGWQDYAVADPKALRRIDPAIAPISAYLGVLGINGLSAYFGLLDVGRPKPGETVVASTAAGAVGSCVGQIARIGGCRAVGITGGAEKVALCRDVFGYNAAVDYKGSGDLAAERSRSMVKPCRPRPAASLAVLWTGP